MIELKDNYDWVKKKFTKKRDHRSHSIEDPKLQTIEMNIIKTDIY